MRIKKIIYFITIISVGIHAQNIPNSSSQLQTERALLKREIQEIQQSMISTRKNKKATLREMQLLQKKLNLRKRVLANLDKQIIAINQNIDSIDGQVKITENLLKNLKIEYANFIVSTYKHQTSLNIINFLFNSQNLYSAIRTLNYLKFFRTSQLEKAEEIKNVSYSLQNKLSQLEYEKHKKINAKNQQIEEQQSLLNDKSSKDEVIKSINSQEKELLSQIKAKKRRDAQLKSQIASIVKREIAEQKRLALKRRAELEKRERKEAERRKNEIPIIAEKEKMKEKKEKKASSIIGTDLSALDDTEKKINEKFISNKGKMPWPVKGIVVTSFGEDMFQGSQVSGASIGTDFQTPVEGDVKAICDGIVSVIFNQDGMMVVILRHGLYFSAYSNLSSVNVSKGEYIKMGQVIGKAGAGEDSSKGELLLILSNDKGTNLDPELWLSSK